MSIFTKLALGSLAAFALFRSKKIAARAPVTVADEPARAAMSLSKQPRRKVAARRAPVRRGKSA